MKDYILIIKTEKGKEFIECRDMKEVETRVFERSNKILNFEVYKSINTDELLEFTKLCFKRLIDNLK